MVLVGSVRRVLKKQFAVVVLTMVAVVDDNGAGGVRNKKWFDLLVMIMLNQIK
jgi:hypothetical protein